MNSTPESNHSLFLPKVIMGLWAAGGMWWGPADDRKTRRAVHTALDNGFNAFDTAPVYGLGHSEELLGKIVRGIRAEVLICTKAGLVWDKSGQVKVNLDPESLQNELEDSLRRMGTDYIDLFQIHWPGDDFHAELVMPAMEKMRSAGKIRWVGVSNFNTEQLNAASRFAAIDSLQPPYNMIRSPGDKSPIPWCIDHDVPVLAYGPLARGLLTGKYDERVPKFGKRDIRSGDRNFQGDRYRRIHRFVQEELAPVAKELGISISGLVLSWTISTPGISHAISGIRTPEQVHENIQIVTLTEEIYQKINRARESMLADIQKLEE